MFWIDSCSPNFTEKVGYVLGTLLEPNMVVGLWGSLGAGKTCLAAGVLRGMGILRPGRSPTFTLINEYAGKCPVYHIDLYRLETLDDAVELGIEEILDGDGVCLIEWADKIEAVLPDERLEIRIAKVKNGDNLRRLDFKAKGSKYLDLMDEFKRLLGASTLERGFK